MGERHKNDMRVRGRTRKLGKKKEFSGRRKEEERVTGVKISKIECTCV